MPWEGLKKSPAFLLHKKGRKLLGAMQQKDMESLGLWLSVRPGCPLLQPCFLLFWKTGTMFPKTSTVVPPSLSNRRQESGDVRGLMMPEQTRKPNFLDIMLGFAVLFSCGIGRKPQTALMEPKSCTVLFWKHRNC